LGREHSLLQMLASPKMFKTDAEGISTFIPPGPEKFRLEQPL